MAELITLDVPDLATTTSFIYNVGSGVSIRVLFISVNMDGSGSGDDYIPTVMIQAPGISVSAFFGQDVLVKAGESVFATWAPYLSPAPAGRETGTYAVQSSIPDLVLTHNWQIWVNVRKKNTIGLGNAAVAMDSLQIGVEQLEGSPHNLAYGPFMLVPGPGA